MVFIGHPRKAGRFLDTELTKSLSLDGEQWLSFGRLLR